MAEEKCTLCDMRVSEQASLVISPPDLLDLQIILQICISHFYVHCLISIQRWETWRFTSSWTTRRRGKKGWLGRVLVLLASSLPHLRPSPPPPPPPPWPPPPQLPPDCQTWTSNELFPMSKIMNQSQKIYNSWFSGLLWSPRPRQPTLLQTLNRGSTKVQNII